MSKLNVCRVRVCALPLFVAATLVMMWMKWLHCSPTDGMGTRYNTMQSQNLELWSLVNTGSDQKTNTAWKSDSLSLGYLRKDWVEQNPDELLPDCSVFTDELREQNVTVNLHKVTYLTLEKTFASQLQTGGHYCPADCTPRDQTAIIIPYRDRREQLMKLLHNLIPFLIRQKICFTVFVVEQTSEFPFNRCLLFNAGFVESQKLGHFSCFIVHDTDLIPRRYGNLYHCHDNSPHHFVIDRSNKPFSGLPYEGYIGGVLAVRRQHMEKINGCSNVYYDWGSEDDDLYER
ncbi:beta-N-acetyl-D-glucosaminide beta-1,4-N-acetylglucosaminyl-transferase-like [Babylonia areolata]|uniref:beta-N-acetyl-D-glucosaminide beta-1,4-N-acetylglucosaminyl-transferase-like n=1 Tax=Babylonia areolata TaxID=304850 RepID=UPI003FD5562F